LAAVFIAGLLACTFVTIEADDECDAKTFSLATYPAALRSLTVIGTQPLTLAGHFVFNNSAEEFIMTGMVLFDQFGPDHALTACRSMGCSQVGSLTEFTWPAITCKFQCPDGTYEMRDCNYILKDFACASDAMDLVECIAGSLFFNSNWYYGRDHGVDLVCTKCGGNSSFY